MEHFRIGQILSSRLCHDLVTPVGAVLSGLELLEENLHNDPHEIIDLLRLSAQESARRLNLLRLCFGEGAAGTFHNLNQISETLKKSLNPEKFTHSVQFPDDYYGTSDQLKTMVQLTANLVSISCEALPYGGVVELYDRDGADLCIHLSGKRVTLNDEVLNALHNGTQEHDLNPRNIQAFLCWTFASDMKKKIEVAQKDQEIYIKVSCS